MVKIKSIRFQHGSQEIRLTMAIVGFKFRSSPYFALLNRAMCRCAVLSVRNMVGASLFVAWGDLRFQM